MYDSKCLDLAQYFLGGEKDASDQMKADLAKAIQDAVEDWFYAVQNPTSEKQAVCEICGSLTTFEHDHKDDLSGLDDGPELAAKRKRRSTPAGNVREIRLRAWETRRVRYGSRGHR